jgi:hypothetical protein
MGQGIDEKVGTEDTDFGFKCLSKEFHHTIYMLSFLLPTLRVFSEIKSGSIKTVDISGIYTSCLRCRRLYLPRFEIVNSSLEECFSKTW